jgi:peptidoglycan hydrolase CwlO-like protein
MKGKTLENIVLGTGVVAIATASFLMFYDKAGIAAKSVNIIFSTGFIIYIIYSYILSQNLNGEIYDLKKHVNNLKEEVQRLNQTLGERNQTIASQKTELALQTKTIANLQAEVADKTDALAAAITELESLKAQINSEE